MIDNYSNIEKIRYTLACIASTLQFDWHRLLGLRLGFGFFGVRLPIEAKHLQGHRENREKEVAQIFLRLLGTNMEYMKKLTI